MRVRVSTYLALLAPLVGCGDAAQGTTEPGTTAAASTGNSTGTSGDPTDTSAGVTGSSSSSSTGFTCPPNAPPVAPKVIQPGVGRIDVVPATLKITGTGFSDPDGDGFGGVDAEIWSYKDGVLGERVWHAELAGEGPPAITLADGSFDGGPLEEWADYGIRLRYHDDQGECGMVSPWSEDLLFRTDDGSSILFDPAVVRDFYLDIPPASWQAIQAQAIPPGCVPFDREYYTGTLRYEDQVFQGVGIKTKGGCGSSRDLNGKASFKVDLEWDDPAVPGCPAARRLLGVNSFTFNNGVQDQSASHERLAYPLYREVYLPAPRAASVRIFVNDQLWGLYTHVETTDRRFLARHFSSNDGMLYEGTYWCDLDSGNLPPTDEDDSKCLTREFKPDPCKAPDPGADPLDYSTLRTMIEQVEALPPGGFYPAITDIFDWDRFLTTWALESYIAHWDNYHFNIKNNYRVYHDPTTQKWTLISTGIDQTFKQDQDPWGIDGVLARRCRNEPPCEAAFAARLAEVRDALSAMDLTAQANAIYQQLTPFVQEDPRKEYGMNAFMNEHQQILNFVQGRAQRITQYLTAHGY